MLRMLGSIDILTQTELGVTYAIQPLLGLTRHISTSTSGLSLMVKLQELY